MWTLKVKKKHNLKNRRFEKLKVLYLAPRKKWKRKSVRCWVCKCDCGNETYVNSCDLTWKEKKILWMFT